MRISVSAVNQILEEAQSRWGVSDWEIEWQFGSCEYEGDIELQETERYALITLDPKQILDERALIRTIYHEVGHCVVWPIWRGMSDWIQPLLGNSKALAIYEESVNTRENEVIDHILVQVFDL